MGDDESKFRDAVRGLAEEQQVAVEVEEQQSPRDKLLEMTGGGEEDVATLRQEIEIKDERMKKKDEELTANQKELTAKQKELSAKNEEIALLKAQLQKLQPPKEGVPPV